MKQTGGESSGFLNSKDVLKTGLEREGSKELEALMSTEKGVDEIGIVCEAKGEERKHVFAS
jgi:hypothetical protein